MGGKKEMLKNQSFANKIKSRNIWKIISFMIFGFLIKYLTEVQISRLFIKTLNMRRRRPSVIWKKKNKHNKATRKREKKNTSQIAKLLIG